VLAGEAEDAVDDAGYGGGDEDDEAELDEAAGV